MRVGRGILRLALANPLEVAETFASPDMVCGGAIRPGVGLGYRDVNPEAFGLRSRDGTPTGAEAPSVETLWAGRAVSADLVDARTPRRHSRHKPSPTA
jgi:alkanesulfonate monooxygenase SsuD/methylene tetrahydromethanopterin reductase-like flavin-dependent oxidoreductase (luciferase family)